MGRAPCCDKANVKKGPWSPEEDAKLKEYIEKHGTGGNWIALPQKVGLKRCGKSCRLRWLNYLRPNIKHGEFSEDEDRVICSLFASIGSRWSIIAAQLPGRTDNDIKNYWNTKLKKKMMGTNPLPHQTSLLSVLQNSSSSSSSSSASSPLSFRDSTNSYYHHPHGSSFAGSDQSISYSSTSLLSGGASANSFFQPQESLMGPIQNYQVKDQSVFMFGGEASCSSSDGSCNSSQMSHVKEAEVGYSGDHGTFVEHLMGVHLDNNNYNYLQSGMEMEEIQKLMVSDGAGYVSGWTEKQSGFWEQNPALDYGIEEIKQLISTGSCNNFLFDENRTERRAVYYY